MIIVFLPDKQQDIFPLISESEPSKVIATLERKLKEAEDELKNVKSADSKVSNGQLHIATSLLMFLLYIILISFHSPCDFSK